MTDVTPHRSDIRELFDATAYDKTGDKLGSVKEVFLDDRTGQPTFVEVGHGLFGLSSSLVPLRGSSLTDGSLNLGFTKDAIKDAPNIDADDGLSVDEENQVYSHFGLSGAKDVDYFTPEHHSTDHSSDQSPDLSSDGGVNVVEHTEPVSADPYERPGTHAPRDASADTTVDPDNNAHTGMGAGAPSGASRSDADTTINEETHVDAAREVDESTVQSTGEVDDGIYRRDDVVEGKAPGDFDRTLQRFPLRRYSGRRPETGN